MSFAANSGWHSRRGCDGFILMATAFSRALPVLALRASWQWDGRLNDCDYEQHLECYLILSISQLTLSLGKEVRNALAEPNDEVAPAAIVDQGDRLRHMISWSGGARTISYFLLS